jgi:hypothetical protein
MESVKRRRRWWVLCVSLKGYREVAGGPHPHQWASLLQGTPMTRGDKISLDRATIGQFRAHRQNQRCPGKLEGSRFDPLCTF